jgi:hypothetical protein
MSSEEHNNIGPDRLFMAFLEEWNTRYPESKLTNEIQEMTERHLVWARTIGAESVIHKLQRTLELIPHNTGKISFLWLMEFIRTIEPGDPDLFLNRTPREYELPNSAKLIYKKRTLKP